MSPSGCKKDLSGSALDLIAPTWGAEFSSQTSVCGDSRRPGLLGDGGGETDYLFPPCSPRALLAANLRDEAGLGRTVRGLKVTADELPDYVERLVRRFEADKDGDETFASWAHRAEEEALQ